MGWSVIIDCGISWPFLLVFFFFFFFFFFIGGGGGHLIIRRADSQHSALTLVNFLNP